MSAVTKGQVSWARIIIAFFTLGLSLPFMGVRKSIGNSKVIPERGMIATLIEETVRESVLYLFAEECLAGGPHRWVREAEVQCAECGAQPRPEVAA